MALAGSLDANVALRLLLGDVPEQRKQARKLLTRGEFQLPDVAVVEMAYVLTAGYKLTRERASVLLGGLMAQSMILSSPYWEATFELWTQRPKLSLEDCLLATQAEAVAKAPLWTFDRKLANQSSAKLVPANDE